MAGQDAGTHRRSSTELDQDSDGRIQEAAVPLLPSHDAVSSTHRRADLSGLRLGNHARGR